MTDLTSEQLAEAIRRGLRENWRRMARLRKAKARSRPAVDRPRRTAKANGAKARSARR
jgi:hypothetical protein